MIHSLTAYPVSYAGYSGNFRFPTFWSILVAWLFPVALIQAQTPGALLVSSNDLSCNQQSATLTASSSCPGNVTFQFSGPGGFGNTNTTGLTSVTVDGAYSVTAVSSDGTCMATASIAVGSSLPPDYLPLVDFYNATNGPAWTNKTGWLTNCDPCNGWFGVSCTAGRVTGLSFATYFPGNNLKGQVPSGISSLTELKTLDLSYNQYLTGTIPVSISALAKLQTLNLSYNRFNGTIFDKLTGISTLQTIVLGYNSFSGSVPSDISNLSNLKKLYAGANYFTGELPSSLGTMINLENLDFDLNKLTGAIPSSLGNLSNLVQLQLPNNQLTGAIPSSLGNLSKLNVLYLGNNQLTGTIPDVLANLTNLNYFGLNQNKLTGTIPAGFSALTKVGYFYLFQNQLTGQIPAGLGNLIQLKELRLESNQLTGPIPGSLSNLTALNYLELQNNQLEGCLPSSLSVLCGKTVNIDNNPGLPTWSDFCATGANGLVSVKDGNWQDPTVWTCGRIPTASDIVTLRHTVTITGEPVVQVTRIRYNKAARLLFNTGSDLKLGH